MKQCCHMDRIT